MHPLPGSFPKFDLDDIILREIEQHDAEDYLNYMTHSSVAEFLTKENCPRDLAAAINELSYWRGLFYKRRSIYWCIALKANNKMIGTAGFNHIFFRHARADISYDLNPEFWGKGLMLKSIKTILGFAGSVLGVNRVQAGVVLSNQRSIKLLERCGFENEGLLKQYEIVNGDFKDYYMYAKIL